MWQVRGFCKDKSNPEVFDTVGVYGNLYDTEIHHNHFGLYSYGETRSPVCWARDVELQVAAVVSTRSLECASRFRHGTCGESLVFRPVLVWSRLDPVVYSLEQSQLHTDVSTSWYPPLCFTLVAF